MKRAIFAVACFGGAAVISAAALVFYFGCCVLPFHRALHHILPMCALTKAAPHGERGPATPAPKAPTSFRRVCLTAVERLPKATSERRSFLTVRDLPHNRMTAGAVRCDDDIGLHTLLATFVI